MADGEKGPIDAKRLPAPFIIGAVLMILGMFVILFAVSSIVIWAIGGYSALGLIGGLLIMPIGILLLIIGGIIASVGVFERIFGKKNRRILY